MKLIIRGQKSLSILGVAPDQNLYNFKFIFTMLLNATNVGGNWLFLFYDATTFLEYANSVFMTSTITAAAVCILIMAVQRSLIFKTIDLFEKLIEKRMKTPTMRSMYEEPNRVAEKWSRIAYIVLAILTPIGFILPKIIFVYFMYYVMDAGPDAFVLPFLMWFPWDWRTPIGYIVGSFLQYIQTIYIFTFSSMALAIGLGCFLSAKALVKDMCISIRLVDEIANSGGNRKEMMEQLSDFLDTHTGLLELFDVFFNIIKVMCKVFLVWCCTVTSITLLMLQMEISKPEIDYIELLVTISELFHEFFTVGISCELGERACSMFGAIDETVDEIDWYLYPIEIQRSLPIIMMTTQKPIYVELFGSITASRETFGRVMKGGWSFFTVLRNFT